VQVVEALLRGDADAAAERVRQHIAVQGERFGDLLVSLASLHADIAASSPRPTAQVPLPTP